MRVTPWILGTALLSLVAGGASADKAADKGPAPKIANPEGVKTVSTVHPDAGFVEDAMAFDGAGGRLAWVRADAATTAEVNVVDLAQGQTLAKIDVSGLTTWVTRVEFVLDGSKIFVAGRTPDELQVVAGVYDLTGKQLRKWGPATDIALTAGKEPAVAVYNQTTRADGLTHEVAVFRLKDGKALGKKKSFVADANGFVKALDFTILYFQDGYAQLVGVKKGEYDRTKDQRLNDSQALYDVVEGKILRNTPIQDLIGHAKLAKLRAQHQNQRQFLGVAPDGKSVELVTADDKRVTITTKDLPFDHYVNDSLVWQEARDGKLYFSLTIDPVNPDAVNKKVADPEHIDLYVLAPGQTEAHRLARIAKNQRPFAWVVGGGHWAVLRKHKAQDRGGPDLEILELTSK
jgi:hypothetical protein